MLTFVVLLVFAIVGFAIWFVDKLKQQKYIVDMIENNSVDPRFITTDTEQVINYLKQPSKLRAKSYSNAIVLPDGQELSYVADSMTNFKKFSKLSYSPTPKEWEILRGIVKKLYSHLS